MLGLKLNHVSKRGHWKIYMLSLYFTLFLSKFWPKFQISQKQDFKSQQACVNEPCIVAQGSSIINHLSNAAFLTYQLRVQSSPFLDLASVSFRQQYSGSDYSCSVPSWMLAPPSQYGCWLSSFCVPCLLGSRHSGKHDYIIDILTFEVPPGSIRFPCHFERHHLSHKDAI